MVGRQAVLSPKRLGMPMGEDYHAVLSSLRWVEALPEFLDELAKAQFNRREESGRELPWMAQVPLAQAIRGKIEAECRDAVRRRIPTREEELERCRQWNLANPSPVIPEHEARLAEKQRLRDEMRARQAAMEEAADDR